MYLPCSKTLVNLLSLVIVIQLETNDFSRLMQPLIYYAFIYFHECITFHTLLFSHLHILKPSGQFFPHPCIFSDPSAKPCFSHASSFPSNSTELNFFDTSCCSLTLAFASYKWSCLNIPHHPLQQCAIWKSIVMAEPWTAPKQPRDFVLHH